MAQVRARALGAGLRAGRPGEMVKTNARADHWQLRSRRPRSSPATAAGPAPGAAGKTGAGSPGWILDYREPRRLRGDQPVLRGTGEVTSAQWQGTAIWGPSSLSSSPTPAQAPFITTYEDVDQWQVRFENLEVRCTLGAAEATDKASALMDLLRARWLTPGGSARKASRPRPAWRAPCASAWRRPTTTCARRFLSPRTG
jgi:hypothetical protein